MVRFSDVIGLELKSAIKNVTMCNNNSSDDHTDGSTCLIIKACLHRS